VVNSYNIIMGVIFSDNFPNYKAYMVKRHYKDKITSIESKLQEQTFRKPMSVLLKF